MPSRTAAQLYLPKPGPSVTLKDVLRRQQNAALSRLPQDEHAARTVIAMYGEIPVRHAGYELPWLLINQAGTLLRTAFMPEVKRRNRQARADFQRALPGLGVPYRLDSGPGPLWWQAVRAAGYAVPMKPGSYALDTLDGLIQLAAPGDLIWIDDDGEMVVLAGPAA